MSNLSQPLLVLLPIVYTITLVFYSISFFSGYKNVGSAAKIFLSISIALHVLLMVAKSKFQQFPIMTPMDSISMIALSIATIHLIIEHIMGEGKTGFLFISIVVVLQTFSSMFNVIDPPVNALLSNPMFGFHVLFTIWGISSLAISALYGVLYWMLSREIKKYRFGLIYKGLPPLDTLETIGRFSSIIGLVLLGFGLLLGHVWANKMLGYFISFDAKIIITDIAWLSYLIGWIIVKKKKLRGLKLSRISFMGFILFVLMMVLTNLLADSFHRFY